MITDINSLVSGAGKSSPSQSSTTSSIGTIAKLNSELKLIEGMQPIQITSVKNAQTATGNSQLIGVTRNNQQQFTLINDKPSPNLQAGDKGTINVTGNQVTLTVTPPVKAATGQNHVSAQTSSTQTLPSSSTANTTAPQSAQAVSHNTQTTKQAPQNSYQSPVAPTTQQAKTIAQVAIASRPITLTVISSSAESVAQTTSKNLPISNTNATNHTLNTQKSVAPQTNMSVTTTAPSVSPLAKGISHAQPQANTTSVSVAPVTTSPPQATTTQPTSTQQINYSAVVSDGNEQFTLNTKHPLKPGETLNVIVDKQGQLQLYPAEKTNSTTATLTEGLKQTLPKQIAPQEFVSLIRQLSTLSQAQNASALPEKLSMAIDQLVKQLPNIQNLTQSSDAIKQAIQNSGLFSESNLANKTNLVSDLKLNLSRLEGVSNELAKQSPATMQTNTPQQALNMVAGAIERITTSQVRHLIENAQQDGSILPLNVEIPIKDGQSTSIVNLRIDKDKSDNETHEPHKRRWLVQLKFDFEETGQFEARASIQDKKVGILFAVENADTEKMIRERLDDLRANLRSREVEIETLDCFRAKLNTQPNQYQEASHKRLIDVRT